MNEVREVSTSDIKNSEKVSRREVPAPSCARRRRGGGGPRGQPWAGSRFSTLRESPAQRAERGRAEGRGAREEGREGRAMEANCCSPPRPMAAASTRRAFAPLLARLNNDARAVHSHRGRPSSDSPGSFASRVRAEDAAGRDEAAGPTRSAQWAAEGAGEARREGSGQGPRAPAAGASKGRGSRVRPYGRELAPDYLLQSSPPSFRC